MFFMYWLWAKFAALSKITHEKVVYCITRRRRVWLLSIPDAVNYVPNTFQSRLTHYFFLGALYIVWYQLMMQFPLFINCQSLIQPRSLLKLALWGGEEGIFIPSQTATLRMVFLSFHLKDEKWRILFISWPMTDHTSAASYALWY